MHPVLLTFCLRGQWEPPSAATFSLGKAHRDADGHWSFWQEEVARNSKSKETSEPCQNTALSKATLSTTEQHSVALHHEALWPSLCHPGTSGPHQPGKQILRTPLTSARVTDTRYSWNTAMENT